MIYSFLNYSKYNFHYFNASSWSCSIILNKTRNPYAAPAPTCLCQAGPTPWSDTLLLNRTSPNILPLCKIMLPGSLHPLKRRQKDVRCCQEGVI